MKEHLDVVSSDRSLGPEDASVSNWSELEIAPGYFDLDGINWDDLEGLF